MRELSKDLVMLSARRLLKGRRRAGTWRSETGDTLLLQQAEEARRRLTQARRRRTQVTASLR